MLNFLSLCSANESERTPWTGCHAMKHRKTIREGTTWRNLGSKLPVHSNRACRHVTNPEQQVASYYTANRIHVKLCLIYLSSDRAHLGWYEVGGCWERSFFLPGGVAQAAEISAATSDASASAFALFAAFSWAFFPVFAA